MSIYKKLNDLNITLPIARDLECFKQSRDAGSVGKGDLRQIHDDGFRWLALQHNEKPIAEIWRGIDDETATQAHDCAFFAALHGDVKIFGSGN